MTRLAKHVEVTPSTSRIPPHRKRTKQFEKQNGTQSEGKKLSECIPRTSLTQTRNPNPGKAQSIRLIKETKEEEKKEKKKQRRRPE